jgi:GNAT superfamily N-acetyltransferase
VIEKLSFEVIRMNSHNSFDLLRSSVEEFYNYEEVNASAFLSRYKTASGSKEIYYCRLLNQLEEVSSCVLVSQTMLLNGHVVPFYFLTQVITAKKYRGNGYFRRLINEVEGIVDSKGCSIIIVIARRAVSDLYSKVGFQGFSHFPEMVAIAPSPVSAFTDFRLAGIQDLDELVSINKISTSHLSGRVQRTLEDWKLILEYQSESSYRIFLPLGEDIGSYIIANEQVGLEVASRNNLESDKRFLEGMIRNFGKFYIDRNDPLSRYFSGDIWKYNERFEANEGHLIKLVSKVPTEAQLYFDEVTKVKGRHRLSIDFVDQW